MKLSEAIRNGSRTTLPLTDGMLFERDAEGNVHACALGAAWIGSGREVPSNPRNTYTDLIEIWPELAQSKDIGGGKMRSLTEEIWHKNDLYGWSREGIAKWLEGLGY